MLKNGLRSEPASSRPTMISPIVFPVGAVCAGEWTQLPRLNVSTAKNKRDGYWITESLCHCACIFVIVEVTTQKDTSETPSADTAFFYSMFARAIQLLNASLATRWVSEAPLCSCDHSQPAQ